MMKNKVLIVDDNTNNLSVLGNILLSNNFAVQVAENGNAAIQMVKKKQPDLILLDINMPGISGYEVCKILKEDKSTANIPIIFLTAYSETENIVEGFKLGAVDYITKPFRTEELMARVNTHIELKNAKTSLELKNTELQHLNATKDKLFTIIAHDLRGPIGNLTNYIELLKNMHRQWSQEKVERWIDDMENIASESQFLLENLFNWSSSQLNEIKVKPCINDITNVIQQVLNQIANLAEAKNQEIRFIDNGPVIGCFDPEMISIVIRNIVSNAIKFTQRDGKIEISTFEQNDKIVLTIADNGIGIPKEKIDDLFKNVQLQSTYGTEREKGSGFGLLLCHEFITLNNGEISITSEINKGSEFRIVLPQKELS